jgi:hypothetical protein
MAYVFDAPAETHAIRVETSRFVRTLVVFKGRSNVENRYCRCRG